MPTIFEVIHPKTGYKIQVEIEWIDRHEGTFDIVGAFCEESQNHITLAKDEEFKIKNQVYEALNQNIQSNREY